jgi:hypothetical protein
MDVVTMAKILSWLKMAGRSQRNSAPSDGFSRTLE